MGGHDKLFKAVFSEPANAVTHFESFLPAEIIVALDLSRASHVPGSFVDEALSERHTDLLYRIPWRQESERKGRELLLYVLWEHQSTDDSMMAYRMAVYAFRVWDQWLIEHPGQKSLPPILPLVLYHGEQDWTAATELRELFDMEGVDPAAVDALRPFLPKLQFMLNEVAHLPDEKIIGQGIASLTLLLFKYGRLRELLDLLPDWVDDFQAEFSLGDPGLHNVKLLVRYMMTVNDEVSVNALEEFFAPFGDEAKEIPMTVGEQLIEKGRREGEQKGRREGEQKGRHDALLQTARKLLARGMSPVDVAEATDLPLKEVQVLTH